MIRRIPLSEARPGDILAFNGQGFLFQILSRIIKWKIPSWDRISWHLAPIVSEDIMMDAQFPRLKLTRIMSDLIPENIRAYRITEIPPTQEQLDSFISYTLGCRYDWLVYLLTAFAILLRPGIDFPRVINRSYDCWECAFLFADFISEDISPEYEYPFLTDLLRLAGEC